jgi:hypothetical protein
LRKAIWLLGSPRYDLRNKGQTMLTRDVLKSYLAEMPRGHIFDLTYALFADAFPPGEPDPIARAALHAFADECSCDLKNNVVEGHYELTRR